MSYDLKTFMGGFSGIVFSLLLTGMVHADGSDIQLHGYELWVPGIVREVTSADLNGDGLEDVVVIHMTGDASHAQRFLSVFFQRNSGRPFGAKPDQTHMTPKNAVCSLVADLAGGGAAELGYLTAQGAHLIKAAGGPNGGKGTHVIWKGETFFDQPSWARVPLWKGSRDLNGDGRTDLFLPTPSGVVTLRRTVDGFVEAGHVPSPVRRTLGANMETRFLRRFMSSWAIMPRPAFRDVNADGRADGLVFTDEGLEIWRQSDGMTFPVRSEIVQFPALKGQKGEADAFKRVGLVTGDLNSDQRADLVVMRSGGSLGIFSSIQTTLAVYRARHRKTGPIFRAKKPDQVLTLKGIALDPWVTDVDGDGKPDLIVATIRADLLSNVKKAIFQEVTVTYRLFRQVDGRFVPAPMWEGDVTVGAAKVEGGQSIPFLRLDADVTGDGIRDLITLDSNRRIRVQPGIVTTGWFSGPTWAPNADAATTLAFDTSIHLEVADLDKDGRDDMIMHYPYQKDAKGKVGVVLARKKKP